MVLLSQQMPVPYPPPPPIQQFTCEPYSLPLPRLANFPSPAYNTNSSARLMPDFRSYNVASNVVHDQLNCTDKKENIKEENLKSNQNLKNDLKRKIESEVVSTAANKVPKRTLMMRDILDLK